MSLDTTLDSMEETRFRNKHAALLKQLTKKTHFNLRELEGKLQLEHLSERNDFVSLIYFKLQRNCGDEAIYITRQQFRSIFHICFNMPEDYLMERIFVALDKGVTPYVTLETWINTLSLYLRGTLDEKMNYCFNVYDIMGENLIKRDHMITLMRKSVIKHQDEDVEEAVKDFVDIIIKRIDLDHDGIISYPDYYDSIKKTPALLECLGQCIPSRASVYAFLMTFTDEIRKF